MRKIRKALALMLAAALLSGLISIPAAAADGPQVYADEETVVIKEANYEVHIQLDGFRYGFYRPDGTVIAEPHNVSGISFGPAGGEPSLAESAVYEGEQDGSHLFTVVNTAGDSAKVELIPSETYLQMKITPEEGEPEETNGYLTVPTGKGCLVTLGPEWEAGEQHVSVQMRAAKQLASSASGIVLGYKEDGSMIHARLKVGVDGANELELFEKIGSGSLTKVTSVPCPFDSNWTTISADVNGKELAVTVGDVTLSHTFDYDITGKIGLRTNDDAVDFDDLTITGTTKEVQTTETWAFENGMPDDVRILSGDWSVEGGSAPSEPKESLYVIDARTKGIDPVYGMGDFGSQANDYDDMGSDGRVKARDTANVFGLTRMSGDISGSGKDWDAVSNRGSCKRFVSTFAVFPSQGMAEVLIEEGAKRVAFTADQNLQGVFSEPCVDRLYYFFGPTMEQIYADYQAVRVKEGYPDTLPNSQMFELGWEAYGALGWNAYQSSVMESIQGYLDRGYPIGWAVIGSGFWKGDRKNANQGITTSFGMWDDVETPRSDGLPNPRFPDVEGMMKFFEENDVAVILGLRNNFKATKEDGGNHNDENNGPFMQYAVEHDYLMKNPDGSLRTVTRGDFPAKGAYYLLDSRNEEAVNWYVEQARLWGVDGFKEDAMLYEDTWDDGKWNVINEALVDDGNLIIVRNTAYSIPGDLIRINDSYYGTGKDYHHDPDRMPINLLNFAASGAPNTYPDIIGGTPTENIKDPSFQKYVVRNAQFAALCPSLSMGRRVWDMENPEYEQNVKDAIDWHTTYMPYIYSAAVDSYETGYPYTMTPLYIAYPDDENTYEMISREKRQYQWMIGQSLMAAPQFGCDFEDVDSRDVYLPEGTWLDYNSGEVYQGPTTLKDYPHPLDEMPVFVGGKGILVGRDPENLDKLFGEVFPISAKGTSYTYTHTDGKTKSTITNNADGWASSTLEVWDTTNNSKVAFTRMENGAFRFDFIPGHDYEIKGGEGTGVIDRARLSAASSQLIKGDTTQLTVTATDDAGADVALTGEEIQWIVTPEDAAEVDGNALTAKQTGDVTVAADVTVGGVTVRTNEITIQVEDVSIAILSPDKAISESTAVSDSFDNGLIQWTGSGAGELYTVENGKLHYSNATNNTNAAAGTIVCSYSKSGDVTVEVDVTTPANMPSKKTMGIVLRYQAYEHHYILGYSPDMGFRYIKRNTGGKTDSYTVPDTDGALKPNTTYHFKAQAIGDMFYLYVDGNLVLEYQDTAPKDPVFTSGLSGFYTLGMDADYDNFSCTEAEPFPFTVSGTANSGTQVRLTLDGKTATVPVENGAFTWEVTEPMENGSYPLTAELLDASGEVIGRAEQEIKVEIKVQIPSFGEQRFLMELDGFPGSYAVVTLPENYEEGGTYPVLFEYTGNYWPTSGSTGKVEDAALGYGITRGQDVIWVALPYVGENGGNEITWWGDVDKTVAFAKEAVEKVCTEYGGDRDNLFLCGFSRGAIGVNFLGLADDEIAGLWKGLMSFDHYDGVREWPGEDWGSPLEEYRAEAKERLKRIDGKSVLIVQNPDTSDIKEYLSEVYPDGNDSFTFLDVPMEELFEIPNDDFIHPHNDKWVYFDNEYSDFVRAWLFSQFDDEVDPLPNPNDGACVTSLADRQVIQRDPEKKIAQVTFTGTWAGDRPDSIQIAVEPYGGGAALVDWQDVTVGGMGSWSHTMTVPQGGWYQLAVRTVKGDVYGEPEYSDRWGVGINLLLIGQSNMQGAGMPGEGESYVVADDRASTFLNETWDHLEDPYGSGDNSICGNGDKPTGSMAPALANALIEAYDVPVGIIPAAKSGAGLAYDAKYLYWTGDAEHPGRNPENPADRSTLYGNSIYRAWEAGGCEYIVMNGGEHDVSLKRTGEEFKQDLETLIGYYRQDLPGVPFIYCQLGACKSGSWDSPEYDESITGIRNAMWEVNDPDNGVYVAAVEQGLPQREDNIHYTLQSQAIIGARVAHVIEYILGDETYYLPPTISGAAFADASGKLIDIQVAHSGGTDLVGTGSFTGFEVFADGVAQTVESVVRLDGDTLRLTLSEAAEGNVTLRYFYGTRPDMSNLVTDNSSMGLALNSTPGEFEVAAYESVPGVPMYSVVIEAEHGKVTATPKLAYPGRQVTLSVSPDQGYEVASIVVTDLRGNEIPVSDYRFTMPNGTAKVTVTFRKIAGTDVFTDVKEGAWYYDAVMELCKQGILTGVGGGMFAPGDGVTRATVWTVLARMEGVDTSGGENWYAAAQKWAMDNGISDGTAPDGVITREQLAVMLYRYSGSPKCSGSLNDYPDGALVSSWAEDGMVWAVQSGLLKGGDGGKLLPQSGATRAELAVMLQRFKAEENR